MDPRISSGFSAKLFGTLLTINTGGPRIASNLARYYQMKYK